MSAINPRRGGSPPIAKAVNGGQLRKAANPRAGAKSGPDRARHPVRTKRTAARPRHRVAGNQRRPHHGEQAESGSPHQRHRDQVGQRWRGGVDERWRSDQEQAGGEQTAGTEAPQQPRDDRLRADGGEHQSEREQACCEAPSLPGGDVGHHRELEIEPQKATAAGYEDPAPRPRRRARRRRLARAWRSGGRGVSAPPALWRHVPGASSRATTSASESDMYRRNARSND